MKQKTNTSALTKKDLENILEKKLKNHPTKKDLKNELDKKLENYPTHSDLKLVKTDLKIEMREMEFRLDEKAKIYRDEILNRLDGVMGELAQRREDGLFIDNDIVNLKQTTEDHEGRIKKLETS